MSPITTHVLDTARGGPAEGITITLEVQEGEEWKTINVVPMGMRNKKVGLILVAFQNNLGEVTNTSTSIQNERMLTSLYFYTARIAAIFHVRDDRRSNATAATPNFNP